MTKINLNFQSLFGFHSRKWFWPFFTVAFIGLGYSSTKNILLSNIETKQSNQENLNRSFYKEQSINFKNSPPKIMEEKISPIERRINIENKTHLNQLIKNRNNSLTGTVKVPKKLISFFRIILI